MDPGTDVRSHWRCGARVSRWPLLAWIVFSAAILIPCAIAGLARAASPDGKLVDATVPPAMRSNHIAGAVVAVSRPDGSFVQSYGFGVSAARDAFTAIAVLQQVARGRIRLADRAGRWTKSGGRTTVGKLLARHSAKDIRLLRAILRSATRRRAGTRLAVTAAFDSTLRRWGRIVVSGEGLPVSLLPRGRRTSMTYGDWVGTTADGDGFGVALFSDRFTHVTIAILSDRSAASALKLFIAIARALHVPSPAVPVSSSPPQISGTPRDGVLLTANPGSWGGPHPLQFEYQWEKCEASGAHCQDIAGAQTNSYMPSSQDVESTLRVRVTASNRWASATATSGPSPVVQAVAPSNSGTLPQVSGTARDGQTLSASAGSWSGSTPISFSYQWERCNAAGGSCADVPGADGEQDGLGSGDVGSTMRVVVTASNASLPGGGSAPATSAPSGVVQAIPPSNSGTLPQVSGTARDGQTLSASTGSWSGSAPITFSYQWQRCNSAGGSCALVPGATGAQYLLGQADVDSRLRVSVMARNAAGSASAVSGLSDVVGSARDPVVAVVGDIACPPGGIAGDPCVQARTAALAAAQHPDDVLVLGDNQYNSGLYSEFTGPGAYNATWGTFNPIVHPVPGNHEYAASQAAAGYFQYFGLRANPAGSPSPTGAYSFNLSTWHLVALNSNCADNMTPSCRDYEAGATTAAQNAWLQNDLAGNSSECTLAFWHHPLFSDGFVGPSPNVSPLWTKLYGSHADVILNGHDHLYERYTPLDPSGNQTAGGIRELVVGSGGEVMDGPPVAADTRLEASDPNDFGVLVMTLHPTSYDWKFLSIGPDGVRTPTVVDSGTTACHGPSAVASPRAARDLARPAFARLSGRRLVFDASPVRRTLGAVARRGLPVNIHLSRAADVRVTVWLRQGGRLRRIASFAETESQIPRRSSRTLLPLPAGSLQNRSSATLVLRFSAVDSADHHRVLTRIVRLTRR